MYTKVMLLLNIVLILTLTFLLIYYRVPSKLVERFLVKSAPISYRDNIDYKVQRSLYKVYKKTADLVFLGDSLTYKANWDELLDKENVLNRGICSDSTEGLLNRLEDIVRLKPRFCFIMGGINDITAGIQIEKTIENYRNIIETLKGEGITPVVESTLFLSAQRPNYKKYNACIKKLNDWLRSYTLANGIDFIDLNAALSDGEELRAEYSYDGTHLWGNGYKIWAGEILKFLNKENN